MIKYIHICDCCGKELKTHVEKIYLNDKLLEEKEFLEVGHINDPLIQKMYSNFKIELCPECAAHINMKLNDIKQEAEDLTAHKRKAKN